MYIAGFVIPVPEEKMEAYRKWAENGAALFREYGCIEIVDSWEDNVPIGKYTDFRRAVDAKDGEKIVFSWQVWPDKATLDSAEAKMHKDERFEVSGEIPFDPKRLILGCFKPLYTRAASEMSAFRPLRTFYHFVGAGEQNRGNGRPRVAAGAKLKSNSPLPD
jgi:uncharacterized protein YbaA (DUF1428 family)